MIANQRALRRRKGIDMAKPKYDHDEVRCEFMTDSDCENLMPGTPRTCCVCAEHDCEEARTERAKHPKVILPDVGSELKSHQSYSAAIYRVSLIVAGDDRLSCSAHIRKIADLIMISDATGWTSSDVNGSAVAHRLT